jgi:hypothetical protein
MMRSPSLRDLRRNLPENVVILPTAAPRQVQQGSNKAGRAERRALRDAQTTRFPHKQPGVRQAEKRAVVIARVEQTASMILVHAVLSVLDENARLKVIGALAERAAGSEAQRQAYEVANTTMLNFGQQWDLMNALSALRGEL